jgi:membrane-associated phospholipid phosphatase
LPFRRGSLRLCSIFCLLTVAVGQSAPESRPTPTDFRGHVEQLESRIIINLIADQKRIWTSPFQANRKDLPWLVPAAAIIGGSLHRDAYMYSHIKFSDAGGSSRRFSDAGFVAMGALVGTSYVVGRFRSNDHLRETGILGAQAFADTMAINYALKFTLRRQRPFNGSGGGDFFTAGGDSFPSTHAAGTWALATVVAHEYPGWVTKAGVYGLATAVSVSRVTGRRHFPTDVLVGSVLGYGIGSFVYRRHHHTELPADNIGKFVSEDPANVSREVRSLASAYVPLDHWAYDAFDRLAGLGALNTNLSNMKPWTRIECARLVQETEVLARSRELDETHEISRIARALMNEFRHEYDVLDGKENRDLRLESVYARITQIEGPTLTDGYHFGQTVYNDIGRPNREGSNFITGASGYGVSRRWVAYVRGEYQSAESMPALPLAARQAISAFETTPLASSEPFPAISRFRLLDAYVGYTWRKWQLSFGNQSLWWGPATHGALNFSNNSEPVTMLRLSTVRPIRLPWVFGLFGPTRGEGFIGSLRGHQFILTARGTDLNLLTPPLERQPLIHGFKVAFKPTPNFEFGASVTTIWGGAGVPLNLRTFWRSFSSGNTSPGQPLDPGDRRAGFDFKYRIPGLRQWLTLYNDSMTEDEYSPIGYPRRSAMAPGLYLSHVPGLPKLDLRAEGYYTDLPGLRGVGAYYFNFHYLGGFTNQGNIMGHPAGRQGNGYAVFARYWTTPHSMIGFTYRNLDVNRDFFQGGSIQDIGANVRWRLGASWQIDTQLQHERWQFPVLVPDRQTNTAVRIGVRFALPPS